MVSLTGYGLQEMTQDIQRWETLYAKLGIDTGSIGTSVLDQPIPYLQIGQGPRKLLVQAAMHANEWITAPCLMDFMYRYAQALHEGRTFEGQSAEEWLAKTCICAIPMVNPDGVELVLERLAPNQPFYSEVVMLNNGLTDFSGWKANIRGVDLNDQFPAYWEEEAMRRDVEGPGPRDYGGPAPLSEPEARALVDWTAGLNPDMTIALHTQGKEIYWNYRDMEPSYSESWARSLGEAIGYPPIKLSGSDAGYKDWFIAAYGRPGFTIELGKGVNPLPLEDLTGLKQDTHHILSEAMNLLICS